MCGSVWFAALSICLASTVAQPTVKTAYGIVAGFDHNSVDGFRSEIFLGIPYAEPPVGELRFEKTQPLKPWPNVLNATQFGPPCATYFPGVEFGLDNEDCLTLNIYKPKTPSPDEKGYPVLVHIHGGAFIIGYQKYYGYKTIADTIVSKDVVVVTLTYRLGFFGFLSTSTGEVPGNNGIWDQIEALRFIKTIISNFGGDPQKITIYGDSAGAACVSYLSLTPHAEDLFQQGIQMSGSSHALWTHGNQTMRVSEKIIAALECTEALQQNTVKNCLRQKTVKEIQNAISTVVKSVLNPDSINLAYLHPVLNSDLFGKAETYEEIVNQAPERRHLISVTSQEDTLFSVQRSINPAGKYHPMSLEQAGNLTEAQFNESITAILNAEPHTANPEYISRIITYYLAEANHYSHDQLLQASVQFYSDIAFNVPAIREAKLKAAANHPVWFYQFDYAPNFIPLVDGTSHGAELSVLFDHQIYNYSGKPEDEYRRVKADLADLYVSFIKTGIPSTQTGLKPERVSADRTPHIVISSASSVHPDLWSERVVFYDSLYSDFGYDLPSNTANQDATRVHHDL